MELDSGLDFLNGGGEVGERLRALDWAATELGVPQKWPQSLKTIVRVMLDSRFAMWLSWGPSGIFFCNDAYLPTVGIKREWVLGARSDHVWEEIWSDIGPRIQHVLTTGEATWDEALLLFLRRSGSDEETFHTFSYSPVYDDANVVAGMLCVVVEETERVIGARRLGLLRQLAAVPTGTAQSIEEAGRLMLGLIAQQSSDVAFAALYLPDDTIGDAALAGATRTPAKGEIPPRVHLNDELSMVAKSIITRSEQIIDNLEQDFVVLGPWHDATSRAVAVPVSGSRDSRPCGCLLLGVSARQPLDDRYRSFLTLVADQFESKFSEVQSRLNAQLKADALAELDRSKNLFFNNVSHELRTPLTLLLGPIDNLLARRDLAQDVREEFTLAQRNGMRLKKLVNSLLDFSRIQAGRVEMHFRPTDLGVLTADLASAFRAAIEEAGLRMVVRTEAVTEAVYVDRDMWEQVVLNLLSNAFKFTFEGEIEVVLTAHDGHARLMVRDTGIGIAKDALPQVFDRFHRVAGARSRAVEGTGIGLALVKELIKLHGGTVVASSEPGKGTTFTVAIPLGRAHLPAGSVEDDGALPVSGVDRAVFVDEALAKSTSVPQTVAASAPNANLRPATDAREHVHLVDDNADMRTYIQRLLEPHWKVTTSSDGVEALLAIARELPDLLLTDMMMPRLDGRALIKQLRANPVTEALPVIVLSAQAGEEARVAGLNDGADDYLVKPFSTLELLARIEVHLMRARLRRAHELTNKRLADIFRNAPVGVAILTGPDLVYEYFNPIYSSFTSGRAVLGLPLRDALPELREQAVLQRMEEVYLTGIPHEGHAYPVDLLDTTSNELVRRYFEFVHQPLRDDGERPSGIVIIGVDVTELMSARLVAEKANRMKDEFIAILGHELRNPLAPISAALELMKLRAGDVCMYERELIKRQVTHMVRLVDDLLDVSRISRGSFVLQRAPIELASAVEQALETIRPLLRQQITVDVSKVGLLVWADADRLVQILSNLLANAVKFTQKGGSIMIRASREGPNVVCSVRDSGQGMTADELESVFGLFVQGHQEIHRPQGGLGLGLAIASSLAKMHGGALSAASDGPGKGSEFTLRLPRSITSSSEVIVEANAVPNGNAKGRRVLLVEDSIDARTSLAELLEELGHEVLLAEDGQAALVLAADSEPFDVAIIDIGLPVMNGFEVAHHLTQSSYRKPGRLIALSGYGQTADRQKAEESGFDAHLVKPVDIAELLQLIASA